MDRNNEAYYVQAVSYDKEFETFAGVQNLIITIGVFGIVIGILYSIFFGSKMTNPLKKLVWAVEEIEKENYNVNVDVTSTDEIGALSKTFEGFAFCKNASSSIFRTYRAVITNREDCKRSKFLTDFI